MIGRDGRVGIPGRDRLAPRTDPVTRTPTGPRRPVHRHAPGRCR
jgi:hypothetical protein